MSFSLYLGEARSIGGMNHVLFSEDTEKPKAVFGHGVNGMELLINGLLQRDASRKNLRSKVFVGARMIKGLSDAGLRNGEFAIDFLNREGIEYVGEISVGKKPAVWSFGLAMGGLGRS